MQYSLYGDNIQAEKSNKHKCLHFGKCNITTEDTTGVSFIRFIWMKHVAY